MSNLKSIRDAAWADVNNLIDAGEGDTPRYRAAWAVWETATLAYSASNKS